MSEDRVDISEPLEEICRRLGLEYHMVKRIEFGPRDLRAIVYKANADGHKHVEPLSGEPVLEELSFEVRT